MLDRELVSLIAAAEFGRGAGSSPSKAAGNYITKLPKAVHEATEWQAAIEALMLVLTHRGPMMFARIAVLRALSRARDQSLQRKQPLAATPIWVGQSVKNRITP
jgi:hypothetical protein